MDVNFQCMGYNRVAMDLVHRVELLDRSVEGDSERDSDYYSM
jgi:hypothetical protein